MGCGASTASAPKAEKAPVEASAPVTAPVPASSRARYVELVTVPGALEGLSLVGKIGPQTLQNVYPKRKVAYKNAEDLICLEHGWMQHTRQLGNLQLFDHMLKMSPELGRFCRDKACTTSTVSFCRSLVQTSAPDITGYCTGFGNADEQARLALACAIMAAYETGDGVMAVFERVADRQGRCSSARKQAYTLLIQHSALILERQQIERSLEEGGQAGDQPIVLRDASTRSLSNLQAAKQRIYECVEEYIDQHKEQAFLSALHEPARFVHVLNNNQHGITHVEVHATNGFLTMLRGGLGVQLPRIPDDDDPYWSQASVGCWDANFLTAAAWEVFSKPEHFGLYVEGIKEIKSATKSKFIGSQAASRGLGPPREIEECARKGEPSLAVYMERYAYFFRREFIVRRMFEVLHSESKPEHMGFKEALKTVYDSYRIEAGIDTESYVEHFYDEYIMNLDIDAVANMLHWLGILKAS